ncbi:MAG: HEPN domain-containing protein [Nanoarchaeota archaeon]
MKEFEFYLKKNEVKRQKADLMLSHASFHEALDRLAFANNIFGKEQDKYVLENAYEAMREAADALLYREGYKSYSHEASIVFLLRKGFSEQEIAEFDRFRRIRNTIKYSGGSCDREDARMALEFSKRIIDKIKPLLT